MYENNCKVGQYFNVDYFQFIRTTVVKFKILSYFKYLDSLPPSQQTNEILSPSQILPTPQNNDNEKVSSSFKKCSNIFLKQPQTSGMIKDVHIIIHYTLSQIPQEKGLTFLK